MAWETLLERLGTLSNLLFSFAVIHKNFLRTRSVRFFSRVTILLAIVCGAGHPLGASVLNDQEQTIANDMIHDPNQKRPFLTLDPVLAQVARARAEDMAKRNYFSHVTPDGVAANYLVRQAGYPLPDWWGNSPTDNFIESIAAGYSTPEAAWQAWMNSTDHRTHILALDPFYATETSYGVGFYADPNSTYKYYWVIITAPPRPAPKLVIASPAAGARVTSAELNVTGSTNDATTQSIEVRLENANGVSAYQPATGLAAWSAGISGFAPGANTIRARSLDTSGNVIAVATCAVTFVEMGPLTLSLSGSGNVTAGFAGTTAREVGKKFTITASPAAGNLFAGWSGDVVSKSTTLTFTMQNSMTLQANFIANFFPSVRGNYSGLIVSGSNDHNGFVRIAMGSTGVFSGRLLLDGCSYAFTGHFDLDGNATINIKQAAANPLTLHLQIDTTGSTNQIAGTISDGAFTTDISADRAMFNITSNRAPEMGRYTVVLSANADFSDAQYPQGDGFALLFVNADGTARIVGRTGDATAFSQTSMVSPNGALPIYVPLYAAKGFLAGTLNFEATDAGDFDGTLNWTKPAREKDKFYPAGFAMSVPTVSSLYSQPMSGVRALNFADDGGNGVVALGDGNLENPIAQSITFSSANKITMTTPSPQKIALSVNVTTGLISGKFTHPADHKPRTVLGVVFQKQNSAFGLFGGVNETGYLSMAATPVD